MTKKSFIKHLANIAIWLVKASITVSLLTGVIVTVAIFGTRGTLALLDTYGPLALVGELFVLAVGLMIACGEAQQSRQKMLKAEREAAFEESEPPEKSESRWRRNAPTTLTDVPLEEWSIGALTILRQIELAFDSKHVYESTTCEPILRAMEPTRRGSFLFVDDNDPVVLREFIRNGGVAEEYKTVNFSSADPSEIKLAGYRVGFYVAKTDDALSDIARSVRSEAQAEIDRRALENKKEAHRD